MHTMVYVRSLTDEEQQQVERLLHRSPTVRMWRRARAIRLSQEGVSPPRIASVVLMSARTVRDLIRAFNRDGIRALHDAPRSGRKKNFLAPISTSL